MPVGSLPHFFYFLHELAQRPRAAATLLLFTQKRPSQAPIAGFLYFAENVAPGVGTYASGADDRSRDRFGAAGQGTPSLGDASDETSVSFSSPSVFTSPSFSFLLFNPGYHTHTFLVLFFPGCLFMFIKTYCFAW